MGRMKTTRYAFLFSTVAMLASGCAATQLQPGAERVLVTHAEAPSGCRYLGSVFGNQGDSSTVPSPAIEGSPKEP